MNQTGGNAELSQLVYTPENERGQYDGFTQDKSLSSTKRGVFVNESKREVVFTVRGTNPKNVADLGADLFLVFDKLRITPRYRSERRALKRTLRKYPKRKYSYLITGHSLGGSIAEGLSREFKLKAKVYNPGKSIGHFKSGVKDRLACKLRPSGERCQDARRIEVHRTKKDPISLLGSSGVNVNIVPQKEGESAHSIANFT